MKNQCKCKVSAVSSGLLSRHACSPVLDWSRLCAQLGCARLCSAVLNLILFLLSFAGLRARLGSARIGCARLGSVALGSAELASCSFWLGSQVVASVMVSHVFLMVFVVSGV